MTQARDGNGDGQKPNPSDIEVYEPAFAPGDEDLEAIGWVKTDVLGTAEDRLIQESDLPEELKGDEPTQS